MFRNTWLGLTALTVGAGAIAFAQQPPPQPGQPGGFPPGDGQFRPGMPAPMPMMGPSTPELAKKLAAISALREIQNLRMTSKDISAALPLLKDLREAEKALEGRAGEILEQERRALLAAGPDTQVPPTSGERLRQANEQFQRQSQQAWQALFQKLGPNIAGGLQRILQGGMGMGGPFPPMPGPGGFGPGQGFGPGPGFDPNGVRPGLAPPGGDGPQGAPGRPGPGEVGPPPGAPGFQPQPPGGPGFQGQPGFPGRPGPQGRQGGRGIGRQQGTPGVPPIPGRPGGPGVPGFGVPGGGMGFGGPGFGPRVTLAELIDLLQQKQAAMRS